MFYLFIHNIMFTNFTHFKAYHLTYLKPSHTLIPQRKQKYLVIYNQISLYILDVTDILVYSCHHPTLIYRLKEIAVQRAYKASVWRD